MDTATLIAELEAQRDSLNAAITALRGKTSLRGRKRGRLSAAARRRISEGMRRKWAQRKKHKAA
jgi:hypothetical protein